MFQIIYIKTVKIVSTFFVITLLYSFVCCSQSLDKNEAEISKFIIKKIPLVKAYNINDIIQDNEKNYWVATDSQGIFTLQNGKWFNYTTNDGLCSNFVWKLKLLKNNKIIIKTRDCVSVLFGNYFETVTLNDAALDTLPLQEIEINRDVVMYKNKYYNIKLTYNNYKESYYYKHTEDDIYSSMMDSKGQFWFGTERIGLCMYNGKNYTWYDENEVCEPIRCLFEDNNKNIWFGNNGYGLFHISNDSIENITKKLNVAYDAKEINKGIKEKNMSDVWSIAQDTQKNIWIGTMSNGLWKLQDNDLTNYTIDDGISSNAISTIFFDNNNLLWIGTYGSGINIYDGNKFHSIMKN